MLDAYDFTGINVLADIGGGNGSLLSAVLARYPKMKGILFDLDHVGERAKKNLKAAGLADRCTVLEGSFFESIPVGADAYLFRHIIHDWTDEQCHQILGHCRKVIPANGKLTDRRLRGSRRQHTVPVQRHGHGHAHLPGRPGTHRSPVSLTAESLRFRTQIHHSHRNNDPCRRSKTSLVGSKRRSGRTERSRDIARLALNPYGE
jgi:hypothetical protein